MDKLIRFLVLVVILNIVRYTVPLPLEWLLIYKPLFAAMQESPAHFNTSFTTFDWVTSYLYNFLLWMTAAWLFLLLEPVLKGNYVIRSLKVYGLVYLLFASISAIYMNHYSHPKDFYLWNLLDGLVVFPLVAVANGLLFPLFFNTDRRMGT